MSATEVDSFVSEDEIRFRKILSDQVSRYPNLQIQDLYKLIHQGTMGSEHAIDVPERARTWFEKEIKNLQPGPEEPVVDPVSLSGEIVRINLRPYLSAGGNPEHLIKAFIRTTNEYKGSFDGISKLWSFAENLARDEKLGFRLEELSEFYNQMAELGFPAMHHSEIYKESYHPAYRVVSYSIFTGWRRVEG
jgi:hypothetical protein